MAWWPTNDNPLTQGVLARSASASFLTPIPFVGDGAYFAFTSMRCRATPFRGALSPVRHGSHVTALSACFAYSRSPPHATFTRAMFTTRTTTCSRTFTTRPSLLSAAGPSRSTHRRGYVPVAARRPFGTLIDCLRRRGVASSPSYPSITRLLSLRTKDGPFRRSPSRRGVDVIAIASFLRNPAALRVAHRRACAPRALAPVSVATSCKHTRSSSTSATPPGSETHSQPNRSS